MHPRLTPLFWEKKLCLEATHLSSLSYFKPDFYSLSSPHPLWTTAGSSPYEIQKATVQARMLSGRYRTEKLRRHWSSNSEGFCLLPSCSEQTDDLPHILLACPSLQEARDRVRLLWTDHLTDKPHIDHVVKMYTITQCDPDNHTQFLLDASVLPEVISCTQDHGQSVLDTLFYLTRTFCYSIHTCRLKLLGIF